MSKKASFPLPKAGTVITPKNVPEPLPEKKKAPGRPKAPDKPKAADYSKEPRIKATPKPQGTPLTRTCKDCWYWNATPSQCRRYPPINIHAGVTGLSTVWSWPAAMETDWCGEWLPPEVRPEEPPPVGVEKSDAGFGERL